MSVELREFVRQAIVEIADAVRAAQHDVHSWPATDDARTSGAGAGTPADADGHPTVCNVEFDVAVAATADTRGHVELMAVPFGGQSAAADAGQRQVSRIHISVPLTLAPVVLHEADEEERRQQIAMKAAVRRAGRWLHP